MNSGKPGFEVINPILIGNENYLLIEGGYLLIKKIKQKLI